MKEAWEGLYVSTISNGVVEIPYKYSSISEAETLDLFSEGEIEGLVSGYYVNSGVAGEVGFRTSTFVSYPQNISTAGAGNQSGIIPTWIRSIYLNEIPVLNSEGLLNFSDIDVKYVKGTPTGDPSLTTLQTQYLSRIVGEQLFQSNVYAITGSIPDQIIAPTSYQDNFNYTNTAIGRSVEAKEKIELGNSVSAYIWPTQLSSINYPVNLGDNIKIYKILNQECVGVNINFKVGSLGNTLTAGSNAGSIQNTTVYIHATYRPLFKSETDTRSVWVKPVKTHTITGKITYGAFSVLVITFDGVPASVLTDANLIGWEILIFRSTKDSFSAESSSQIFIDSISEKYKETFSYPNSAIVRCRFSSEYFQQIPQRAFKARLIKVKVPSNYNPITRTYNETTPWDGTFKEQKAWTNNPAWCYYDLITNRRYGLGKYIDESLVDKWTLYDIGKYCDVLVYDGYGNLEPRFTFNWWFTSREDAFKVVNDMASAFRAMSYYGFGSIYSVQDSPKNDTYFFTNANIEDGNFSYSSSTKKDRHTVAIIRYNDPYNNYRPAMEYIENVDGIRKYGIREIEFTAFGCSSRGQAIRMGRWMLLSENLETELISFIAGYEAAILRPGDVFGVYDANRKSIGYAGRTTSIQNNTTGTTFYLDRNVTLHSGRQYTLNVLVPTYYYQPAMINDLTSADSSDIRRSSLQRFSFSGQSITNSGTQAILPVTGIIDTGNYNQINNMIWSIDIPSGFSYPDEDDNFITDNIDYYRVIRITEKEEGKFEIGGLQYAGNKYLQIESGIGVEIGPTKTITIPTTPTGLNLTLGLNGNINYINYTITLPNTVGVTSLLIYAKPDTDFAGTTLPDSSYLINKIYNVLTSNVGSYLPFDNNKTYFFRVYSRNDIDDALSSSFATGSIAYNGGFDISNVTISALNLTQPTFRDGKKISSIAYNPTFTWQVGTNYNTNLGTLGNNIPCRVTVRSPTFTDSSAPTSTVYYETTGIIPVNGVYTWTFPLQLNSKLFNGPLRQYDVVIEAHNATGKTSAGNAVFNYSNETFNLSNGKFDMVTFYNPIQTTIELSNNVPTADASGSALTNPSTGYMTTQWIGTNGELIINFSSGYLSDDIIGGYVYVSSGLFPKKEALLSNTGIQTRAATGNFFVYRYEFKDFNPRAGFIYHPVAGSSIKGMPSGYVSVSFYDKLDAARLTDVIDPNTIITGLYLSHNAIITNKAFVGSINVANMSNIQLYNYGTASSPIYRLISIDNSGKQTIITSNITI